MAYHADTIQRNSSPRAPWRTQLGAGVWVGLAVLATFAAVALLAPQTPPTFGHDGSQPVIDWRGNSGSTRFAD